MNLLVAGGAGFIGASLVDRALDLDHEVDVIDDLSSGSLSNLAEARARRTGSLRIHHTDLGADGVDELIVRRRPDAIVHLARTSAPRGDRPALRDRVATEVAALGQLLDAAARTGSKVVIVGDAPGDGGDDPVQHVICELGWALRDATGVPVTVVDLPTVYGVRQQPGRHRGVVATFAHRIVSGAPCVIHGTGVQRRDLLHVDDAVDGILAAATAADGLRIELGTGESMSIAELATRLAALAGGAPEPVPGAARTDDPGDVVVDPARASMYLRWQPLADRDAMLAEVLTAARSRAADTAPPPA